MTGGELVREARKRADLTQRELAELMGTTQAVIARWETGVRSPTLERVQEAVRACGLELAVRIVRRDDQHALLVEDALRLSPEERLDRLFQATRAVQDLRGSVVGADAP